MGPGGGRAGLEWLPGAGARPAGLLPRGPPDGPGRVPELRTGGGRPGAGRRGRGGTVLPGRARLGRRAGLVRGRAPSGAGGLTGRVVRAPPAGVRPGPGCPAASWPARGTWPPGSCRGCPSGCWPARWPGVPRHSDPHGARSGQRGTLRPPGPDPATLRGPLNWYRAMPLRLRERPARFGCRRCSSGATATGSSRGRRRSGAGATSPGRIGWPSWTAPHTGCPNGSRTGGRPADPALHRGPIADGGAA